MFIRFSSAQNTKLRIFLSFRLIFLKFASEDLNLMSDLGKRYVLSCIAACASMVVAYAQPRAVGGIFSFSGIGIIYEHDMNDSCFIEVDIKAETGEYFMNRAETPGISVSFTSDFILKKWKSCNDNTVSIFAGPGVSVGKSNDFHKDNGYFFGLKGRAGIECLFDRNVAVSMSLNPVIGSHIVFMGDHAVMKYYKNGLMNLIMPEIGIRHTFNQRGNGSQCRSERRFTFGAEWGYVGTFYSGYHYNFFAPEGYRADPRGYGFGYEGNGELYLHAGYDIGEKSNLSVYMGFSAFGDQHHTIPLSIRYTRYYKSNTIGDRWFSFIDLGSGISIKEKPQEILTGKLGGGYRISLSNDVKLDFIVSLRSVLTHPDIDYYGTKIPSENINRNNAYASAISVGMALTL